MSQFRVVYTGPSAREKNVDQLHDVKFDTLEKALEFAKQKEVLRKLSFVQEFDESGTPIKTITPEGLKTPTKEKKGGKS